MASLYTDLPQWKACRGDVCTGPCRIHVPGAEYCMPSRTTGGGCRIARPVTSCTEWRCIGMPGRPDLTMENELMPASSHRAWLKDTPVHDV
jgi:hypothetical protein